MPTYATAPTLSRLPFLSAKTYGVATAQSSRHDGVWDAVSYDELATIADEFGRGLIGLGLEPGARVAILSETRAEWMQAAYGIAAAGCVVVPLYPSSSP